MRVNHTHALETAISHGANDVALGMDFDPKLRVTVVHTTPNGTVAALKSAAALAKQLCARIALVAPEVVPIHFSLERPHVPVAFLEQRYCDLVARAGVVDEPVTIRIWLCRDREASLKQALAPHSLIVVGGSARWWYRSDRKLAQWLQAQGHHVVFVDAAAKDRAEPEPKAERMAAFYRALARGSRGVRR